MPKETNTLTGLTNNVQHPNIRFRCIRFRLSRCFGCPRPQLQLMSVVLLLLWCIVCIY